MKKIILLFLSLLLVLGLNGCNRSKDLEVVFEDGFTEQEKEHFKNLSNEFMEIDADFTKNSLSLSDNGYFSRLTSQKYDKDFTIGFDERGNAKSIFVFLDNNSILIAKQELETIESLLKTTNKDNYDYQTEMYFSEMKENVLKEIENGSVNGVRSDSLMNSLYYGYQESGFINILLK